MNFKTALFYGTLISAIPFAAMAQTTFSTSGGDLDTSGNWSGGLPNTSGNSGSIGVNGQFSTATTGRQWIVTQSAGTVTQDVNTTAVDFDGGSWTMNGGNLNLGDFQFDNFSLTLNSGAIFKGVSRGLLNL